VQVWPKRKIQARAALAAALGLNALLLATFGLLTWTPALLTALLAALAYAWSTRRYYRRRRLVAAPFPEEWRRILERRVDFYTKNLDRAGQTRFEDDLRIFLAEQQIYGAGRGDAAFQVDEEARVLIAASAAILGHGRPDFEWPRLRDIVVHPRSFDHDYKADGARPEIAGMVHSQGPILISARDLKLGYRRADGHNVGLHELAHVLDLADGYADGVPAGVGWSATAPWVALITDRLKKLRRRRGGGLLRDYAATDEAELFAVAVESFFERPALLRAKDPALYALLAEYFNQDPAAPPR